MSTLVIRHFIEMRKREINARAEARRLRAAGGVEPAAANAEEEHDSEPDTASVAQPERDMSFQGVSILEALSATGLRAVRYAKELDDVRVIVANDCSASAVEAIARNAQFNGTHIDDKAATGKAECVIQPNLADAIDLMMQSRQPAKQFDVIDLDPYGTAAIFLDSATQAISEGGLLCVTCTDMAVLCGSGAEAGFAKYTCP
jgi:tRNA (guanine26-N2/guanine27-N2)-dimethyltransferase